MATLSAESEWQVREPALWYAQQEPCRLPPLPLEDVYLHVKSIDNSRLDRARSGSVSAAYARALAVAVLALGMLIVILMPNALQRFAERRLLVLQAQTNSLLEQKLRLETQEAAVLSSERLDHWARSLQLVDPAPGQLLALTPGPQPDVKAKVHAHQEQSRTPPAVTAR